MKYIEADKLIAEIERRIARLDKELKPAAEEDFVSSWASTANNKRVALQSILSFITSLQQEQPEVDLEKELNEWMKYGPHTNYPWCTIPDAIKITAEHFYELGKTARKEK